MSNSSERHNAPDGFVTRGAPTYEAARRSLVWQAKTPERFPDAICQVRSAAEAAEAVKAAVAQGMRVSARSGGHNYHGNALRSGGLALDLGLMQAVTIDPARMVASVQPGVTGGQLGKALDEQGLGFPLPHDPRVAVAGFLLAGGIGLNVNAWGPACSRILSVEVVTSSGEILTASEATNADLLWAARGGGPAFPGIVTRFDIALSPGVPIKRNFAAILPLEAMDALGAHLSQVLPELEPALEVVVLIVAGPGGHRVCVLKASVWADDESHARRLLSPLESFPGLAGALVRQEKDFDSFSAYHDDYSTRWERAEMRREVDAFWMNDDLATLLPELRARMEVAPGPESQMLVVLLPSLAGGEGNGSAFSATGCLNVEPNAAWPSVDDDEANHRWLADTRAALEPRAVGHYVASASLSHRRTGASSAYSAESWERLQQIGAKWDPRGVFFGPLDHDE